MTMPHALVLAGSVAAPAQIQPVDPDKAIDGDLSRPDGTPQPMPTPAPAKAPKTLRAKPATVHYAALPCLSAATHLARLLRWPSTRMTRSRPCCWRCRAVQVLQAWPACQPSGREMVCNGTAPC